MATVPRPSDDEITRVEAWRAEQNTRAHRAYRTRMEELEAEGRDAARAKLVGRTITAVGGELDGTVWHKLVLTLDDGATLTISMVGWDEKTLDLSHEEGKDA